MWFDSFWQILRVVVAAGCAYVALVALLRVSGKRTLAKLNAFDLVVTVALGSTLATIALSSDVAVAEGVTAFVILVTLQFVVAFLLVRSPRLQKAVKATPVAVVRDGGLLEDRLRSERLTKDEVVQAVRASGFGDVSLIAAVVLETDGTLSVVPTSSLGSGSALENVR